MSTYEDAINLRKHLNYHQRDQGFDPSKLLLNNFAEIRTNPQEQDIYFFKFWHDGKSSVVLSVPDWEMLIRAMEEMEGLQVALGGPYMKIGQSLQRARYARVGDAQVAVLRVEDWEQIYHQIQQFLG